MSLKSLNPYINFNGTAEKAIQLYETALGAKAANIMRYGDMPGNKQPEETKRFVMHAALSVGEGTIMISDVPPNTPAPTQGNVHIALHYTDPPEMAKAFEALSAGGEVTQPLTDTFWGAKFGMLTDAFGVNWMFNCELKR